jgi:predicted nuclease of predicted toxin-antitoxin system
VADRPTFFVDHCLGKGVVRALLAAGVAVENHSAHFAPDAADVDWIPVVSMRGWVILTKDKSIRRRAEERDASVAADARIITLTPAHMTGEQMVTLLLDSLPAIDQLLQTQSAPFIAGLNRQEGLRVLLPAPLPPTDTP